MSGRACDPRIGCDITADRLEKDISGAACCHSVGGCGPGIDGDVPSEALEFHRTAACRCEILEGLGPIGGVAAEVDLEERIADRLYRHSGLLLHIDPSARPCRQTSDVGENRFGVVVRKIIGIRITDLATGDHGQLGCLDVK